MLGNIKEFWPREALELKIFTLKTIFLLTLATFTRESELAAIDFHSLQPTEERLSFTLMLQRRAQRNSPLVNFCIDYLPIDELICPVKCLKAYVTKTESLRPAESNGLFIALRKPRWQVGKLTNARWIKEALASAGVDMNVFSAHSMRGAAASRKHENEVPCDIGRSELGKSLNVS